MMLRCSPEHYAGVCRNSYSYWTCISIFQKEWSSEIAEDDASFLLLIGQVCICMNCCSNYSLLWAESSYLPNPKENEHHEKEN